MKKMNSRFTSKPKPIKNTPGATLFYQHDYLWIGDADENHCFGVISDVRGLRKIRDALTRIIKSKEQNND